MKRTKISFNWSFFLIILVAGCSTPKKAVEQPVPVFETPPIGVADPSQTYPEWFLNPPSVLHGVGIVPYNARYEQQSFDDAFILAVQDLNSNQFACVTIEDFLTGGRYLKEEEVAISEKFDFGDVIKLDSTVNNGFVFMMIAPAKIEFSKRDDVKPQSSFRLNNGNAEFVKTSVSIQSKGLYKASRLDLYTGWALSKRASLRILANATDVNLRSVDQKTVDEFNNTTYLKSRVSLKNIRVLKRWIEDDDFCTALEVQLSDVSSICIN